MTVRNGSTTIYDAMNKITQARYAIPPFQREYQWPREKIVRLWDSILMGYPISTFLFWKNNDNAFANTNFLRFTSSAKFRAAGGTIGTATGAAPSQSIEEGVLDGQQRLTSLYLSLVGCCAQLIRHQHSTDDGLSIDLYINLTSNITQDVDEDGFEDANNYEIIFSHRQMRLPFFKFRDIWRDDYRNQQSRQNAITRKVETLAEEARPEATRILNTLCSRIYDEELIHYLEVDGEESEALEMFIRFNNGGKPLTKADIAEATITHYWSDASQKFKQVVMYKGNNCLVEEELIEYKDFGLNFITRLGAMLYENNVAVNLGRTIISGLRNNWSNVKKSLALTNKFLKSCNINVRSYKPRWNVLVPVVYFVYSNMNSQAPDEVNLRAFNNYRTVIMAYLARATLLKYFQNGTTAKLTRIKRLMLEHQQQGNPTLDMDLLNEIQELRVTGAKIDEILESKKGSPIAKIALEWINLGDRIGFTQEIHEDHLQPNSLFSGLVPQDGISSDDWQLWQKYRDMLPNIQLFDRHLNIVKSNRELYDYYENFADDDKRTYQKCYLFFPIETEDDKNLLLRVNFGRFFERRKAVLKRILSSLLENGISPLQPASA